MGAGGDMAAGLNEPPGTFQVEYIDVFGAFFSLSSWKFSLCFSECHQQRIKCHSSERFPNISLLHVGYLGTSLLHPTVAISLHFLELYLL